MHTYVILRKSRITDYIDSIRVEGSTPEKALESCFDSGTFAEESSMHKRQTTYNAPGVVVYSTQLFWYMIIKVDDSSIAQLRPIE